MKKAELFNFVFAYTTTNWMSLPTDEKQWIDTLISFSKQLAQHMIYKIEDENCYAVDMLEDIRDYE